MKAAEIEAVLESVAGRQHGVVSRAQLMASGLASHHVEHRLGTGRLVRLHQGVYRVGPLEAPRMREMAAVLACGANAVISHASAAGVLGLRRQPPSHPIDVGLARGYRRRPGLRVHRLSTLDSSDIIRVERIPVTNAARTLWDLSGWLSPREVERAYAEALDRGLVRRAELKRLLDRHGRAPGSRILRLLLEADPVLTRSAGEERLRELIEGAGLPRPQTNVMVEGMEVDCYWPGSGLVVEVDGFAYHGSAAAFERDRSRDRRLTASGRTVIRVTWRQLDREPLAVIAQLARALAAATSPDTGTPGRTPRRARPARHRPGDRPARP